jgi:hypothetical protein
MWNLLAMVCLAGTGSPSPVDLSSALRDAAGPSIRWAVSSGETLDLEEFDVRASDSQILVVDKHGERPVDLGGLRLWRGQVEGHVDSAVFVGVSKHGLNGWVRLGDELFILSGGGQRGPVSWTSTSDLPASIFEIPGCDVRTIDGTVPRPRADTSERSAGLPPCRVAMLAIDTDWEFTERIFGGDAGAAAAYALTLAGAISEIYVENVNVRLQVSFLRVWSDDSDPYNPSSGTDMLDQFRNEWTSNMADVDRNIAHMMTGRTNLPYGGVAWLSVVCNTSYGYGVSGYLNGYFPQPLQDNHGDNWDVVVMAHELGHNFGTLHTHDGYSPPIDNCGNGDCTGAENGTIMSYCHTCDGGITNIRLGFHERVQEVILAYLDSIEPDCSLSAGSAAAIDDWALTIADETIVIDVLLNDSASDCSGNFDPEIGSFDQTSAQGGVVTLIPGGGSVFDMLSYTPPSGYTGDDAFGYELQTGSSATVYVSVEGLRAPDQPTAIEPGAFVNYYALSSPSVLPDFSSLEPYLDDVVAEIGFQSTGGAFATSGRSDEVGAVFTGYVQVAGPGFYTFSTESDDGSRLYIGEQLVVENDGLHPMIEKTGTLGLMAGRHATRVEFFENTGGAGLVVRLEGPALPRHIIPAWAWSHDVEDVPCPEDVDGDGIVGVNDVLEIIGSWGDCSGCAADVNGDGNVGVDDVLAVISAWGLDC